MQCKLIEVPFKWLAIVAATAFCLGNECSPRLVMSSEYLSPYSETAVTIECRQATGPDTSSTPASVAWSWSNPLVTNIVEATAIDSILLTVLPMGDELTSWTTLQAEFKVNESFYKVERLVWLVNQPLITTASPLASYHTPTVSSSDRLMLLTNSTPVLGCQLGSGEFDLTGELGWKDFDDYAWLRDSERFMPRSVRLRLEDAWPASRVLDVQFETAEGILAHIVLERDSRFCIKTNWVSTWIDPSLFSTAAHELLTISAFSTWCWKIQAYTDPPQIWVWFLSGLNGSPKHYAWVFG